MSDSARAASLVEEWRRLEARIVEIKRELAGVAAESTKQLVVNGTPQGHGVSSSAPLDPSIAPGTKNRATLEVMAELGGRGKAGPIKDKLVARGTIEDGDQAERNVRSYFNALREKEYVVNVKNERGVWALTQKARTALGGGNA